MSPVVTIQNKDFDNWLNAKGLDPNHPLVLRLRKFFTLGANLDIVFALCRMLVIADAIQLQMIGVKKQLASRKSRWTKEFRALCSVHPGGNLRLTEVARFYTDSIIRSTVGVLKDRGAIDSTAEISLADLALIKQRALKPFANMQGYSDDWEAAINIDPVSPNLITAVGLSKVTPECGQWIKELASLYRASVFQNGATKRRDFAGTMFLLFLTEHMRNVTQSLTSSWRFA